MQRESTLTLSAAIERSDVADPSGEAEGAARTAGAFGPWRGSLTLSVFTVIKHRLSLDASGTLLTGGGQGFFEAELFPTKATGMFVSAFAARFDGYPTPTGIKQLRGSGGLTYWFDARSALLAEYTLLHETDPGDPQTANAYHGLSHTLLVEAYFRYR